jgi:hypothetical protein
MIQFLICDHYVIRHSSKNAGRPLNRRPLPRFRPARYAGIASGEWNEEVDRSMLPGGIGHLGPHLN